MAPQTRHRRKAAAVAASAPVVIDPADRLSILPKDILAGILSFLPDQEAVRTCVLARTWRHIWKFTTNLFLTGDSVQEVREFVDHLLRARLAGLVEVGDDGMCGRPLDVCEIQFNPFEDKDVPIVNRWIRLAMACRVQTLDIYMWRLDVDDDDPYFRMSNRPLVSQHLRRLDLCGVWFRCSYLDFSGCPALEHLDIRHANMPWVRKMTCPSVKHLVITDLECNQSHRIRICVPHLVSLRLVNNYDRNPVLESMPELKEAYVEINAIVDFCICDDHMSCKYVMGDVHSSDSEVDSDTEEELDDCGGQNTTKKCMILEGLSQAEHLVLMACKSTYILRRDLNWCPTFSKLKTLMLDDYWCEPTNCCALVRILQHTPILEELTIIFSLQVWSIYYNVEVKGYRDATAESNMTLPCLKMVKIKCKKVDESILSVLNYLGTINICFQVTVNKDRSNSQLTNPYRK